MNSTFQKLVALLLAAALWAPSVVAGADTVTDWNEKACVIVVNAKLTAPGATRVLALVQTAVYEAANAVTRRYPSAGLRLEAAPGASIEAAIAAANRATLASLLPVQQAEIENAYSAALAAVPQGKAKVDGVTVGEKAAAAVLASRANDGANSPDSYRPYTTAGMYVPTVLPIATQWPGRKPWMMTSPDQFRPGPPPALSSELWARDYNEIKALGEKNSTRRSSEQTVIARFWETTQPPIYHGLVRSAASAPGRDVTRNARLFAAASQALDDAYIAVFDAKYHYNFWRPITAIRNGDIDGNDATERDTNWTPLIDTPLHPEYPCAHCILSGAVAVVLRGEFAGAPVPTLTTTSPTATGGPRSWANLDDFMQEVATARILDGVHFRNSTEVGTDMGKKIGALAVSVYLAQ